MAVADVPALAEQLGCAARVYGVPGAALSSGCLETVRQLSGLFRETLPRYSAAEGTRGVAACGEVCACAL